MATIGLTLMAIVVVYQLARWWRGLNGSPAPIHFEDVEWLDDGSVDTTANFDEMMLTTKWSNHDGTPVVREFHLQRLDGPRWEIKMTTDTYRQRRTELEAEIVAGRATVSFSKDALEKLPAQAEWHAFGDELAPKIETAYQKHIHRLWR